MDKISYNWLFLCLLLLCAGNASGWAIARKMIGPMVSIDFLYFAVILSSLVFLVQLLVFARSKERLVFYLAFRAVSGLSVVWYMLCLVLPIFWIPTVNIVSKLAIVAFAVLLFASNGFEGARMFKERWCEKRPTIKKHYNPSQKSLDWDKIVRSLHLSVSLYVPGVSRRVTPVLSVLIVASMIFGLNFRTTFPMLSIFAWGVPCLIVSSTLVQMVTMNIAQALKVVELEAQVGSKIRPLIS